jgi:hypothetical protein
MAYDALTRVSRGLLVVDRDEIRTVHGVPHRLIETESRWNRRHRDAMASRALTLRMARRAQIGLGVRLHSMLTKEVAIVNDVALGKGHFAGQIDVASATVAR